MRPAVYQRQPRERVHVFDATPMPWEETARPGLRLKTIRIDDERGEFLGLIGFDPFVRSGLHQHQGVATSFILEGGLTDYHGPVLPAPDGHQLPRLDPRRDGLRADGARLQARGAGDVPAESEAAEPAIHAGSTYQSFRNPDPDVAARDQRRRRPGRADRDRHRRPAPPADLRLRRQRPGAAPAAVAAAARDDGAGLAGERLGRALDPRRRDHRQRRRRPTPTASSSSSRARRCG